MPLPLPRPPRLQVWRDSLHAWLVITVVSSVTLLLPHHVLNCMVGLFAVTYAFVIKGPFHQQQLTLTVGFSAL